MVVVQVERQGSCLMKKVYETVADDNLILIRYQNLEVVKTFTLNYSLIVQGKCSKAKSFLSEYFSYYMSKFIIR